MKPEISIIDFCEDPNLLAVRLYPEQRRILQEFWDGDYSLGLFALGRRSGKTLLAAISAAYCATVLSEQYKQHLRTGERWFCLAIATNLEQAKIFLNMVRSMLEGSPVLRPMILRSTVEQIELVNGCIFRAIPSSGRGSRGMAVGFLCLDEAAHFVDSNGNNSGDQLYQSLSPSLAQFGGLGRILLTSSPWLQSGLFHSLYSKAAQGDLRAYTASEPSWVMNPSLNEEFLAEQRILLGEQVFSAEYGAQWTDSLSSFLAAEAIDSCINHSRSILLPQPRFKGSYYLALDPARGGRDSYTAAIAHYEDDILILDVWHEFAALWDDGLSKKKQISIDQVESWIIQQHEAYGFKRIVLDQYNSQSTIQRLRSQMPIQELVWTIASKTQAYTKLRELFISRKIDIYNHPRAVQQLKGLIVEYRPSGSWSVSGGTGAAVDDYVSALAGAVLVAEKTNEHWLSVYRMDGSESSLLSRLRGF